MKSLSLRGNEGPGKKEDRPPQDLQEGEGVDAREGSPQGELERVQSRAKTKGKEGQCGHWLPVWKHSLKWRFPLSDHR